MVVAAVVGSAVVGAAGSMIAGSEAADATENAAAQQLAAQRETLAQQERLSAPYRQFGEAAIPGYMQLLGIGPKGQQLTPKQISTRLTQMPGYQFQLGQGLDATKAQAAAMGMGLSGNTLQALNKYSQGLASTSYQNQLANLLAPINIGQASAANQAANVGQAGANMSNIYGAQGANEAGIAANTIGGVTGAIGGGLQNYMLMNTLQGLQGGAGAGGMGGGGFTNPGALGINASMLG